MGPVRPHIGPNPGPVGSVQTEPWTVYLIAWRLMFEEGINITSKRIEELLRPHSLVPTWVSHLFSFILELEAYDKLERILRASV